MVKGIYHCPPSQYTWAKSIGFNLIEVRAQSLDFMLPKIQEAIDSLHSLDMFALLDLHFEYNQDQALVYLKELKLHNLDIIYLYDEPNLKYIMPAYIQGLHDFVKGIKPKNKTMIVLGWTRPYEVEGFSYANCTDIIGLDWYKQFSHDLWGTIKLIWRAKKLIRHHKGMTIGVPAIRYSSRFIKRQARVWKNLIKTKGLVWYSADGTDEIPPWVKNPLWEMKETYETLKEINNASS